MAERKKKADKAIVPVKSPQERLADGHILAEAKVKDGAISLTCDKGIYEEKLVGATGSQSIPFQNAMMTQIMNILPNKDDGDYTDEVNASLAMLNAIAPTNELEAMLAAQMVATHILTMETSKRTRHAGQLPQYQAHANIATKFARTFTTQMEALARYRRGGEQVVRHVHVNEGGQALIAGTVNAGGPAR